MPASIRFASGKQIKDRIDYKYDTRGNICEITENGHLSARYTYDKLNRLIREDNKAHNKTVLFSYDSAGNITERCEYDYTDNTVIPHKGAGTHYEYKYEGDRLVSFFGMAYTYDKQGNPTKNRGFTAEWKNGKLTKYHKTTFAYDSLGRRVKKGNKSFIYDSDGRLVKQSNGLEFIYDASGLAGFKYNNAMYFYRKDVQGLSLIHI